MPRRPRLALAILPLLGLGPLAAEAAAQARPRPGTLPGQTPTRPARPDTAPTRRGGAAPRSEAAPAPAAGAGRVTLRGIVWDSLANAPLAGAVVQVASAADPANAFTVQSDSLGEYRLRGLVPGRYLAGFFHRTLDLLGLEARPIVAELGAADTVAVLDFGTPGPRTVRGALCSAADPSAPLLMGAVRDAETDTPVTGSRVVLTWSETRIEDGGIRNVRRRLPVRTRGDGAFVACNLPADVEVEAGAEAAGRVPGGLITVALPTGAVVRRDFTLGDSVAVTAVEVPDTAAARENRPAMPTRVARGNARLAGTVRGPDGRPLQGARLLVHGTGVTGETSAGGGFALSGLPSGTYSVEVRAIGFTPKRVPVDLTARRPAQVAVTLDNRVATLEGVRVTDRATATGPLAEFEERRKKGGFGRFFSEEDVQQRNAFLVSDVLRSVPGLRLVPRGGGMQGSAIQGRGSCEMTVFVDGNRLFNGANDLDDVVRPQDIAGVEVYNGQAGVPAQFSTGTTGGCGVVAVWTKRGGPRTQRPAARR
jgi:protocatechuate 3,4-dioxygenase beta subunit